MNTIFSTLEPTATKQPEVFRDYPVIINVVFILILGSVSSMTDAQERRVLEGSRWGNVIDESVSNEPVEIYGFGGADKIWGSPFDDFIEGGSGNDFLFAGDGNDILFYSGTNNGADFISGGAGYDRIIGDVGDDTIGFSESSESIEEIDGGGGRNLLVGGKYSDELNFSGISLKNISAIMGMGGSDVIYGSSGDDVIEGGSGNDELYGHEGNDSFIFVGSNTGSDLIRGGAGQDSIIGSPNADAIGLRGYSGANSVEIIDGGGGDDVIFGTKYSDFMDFRNTVLIGVELIDGGGGNDSVVGTNYDDRISGGTGNDTIDGGAGFDTAVFPGIQSEYEIFESDNSATVTRLKADGARETDILISIEKASFRDVLVPIGKGNQAPVATDDLVKAAEDIESVYQESVFLANDFDPDNDPIRISQVNSGNGGTATLLADASISFSPESNFNGDALFTYIVEDNKGGARSGTVTVRVASVNDQPDAKDDTLSTIVDNDLIIESSLLLANDRDPDLNDSLAITAVDQAVNGTVQLSTAGVITFVPASGFQGQTQFAYFIEDLAGASDSALVRVNVAGTNAPPIAAKDFSNLKEDEVLILAPMDLLTNDSDPDDDELEIMDVGNPNNGEVSWNADGSISFVPSKDFWGSADFTYVVSDGVDSADGLVEIEVAPVNDIPIAEADAFSGNVDQEIVFDPGQLLSNDTDVDGDLLGINTVGACTNCTVRLDEIGQIVFKPSAGFKGQASFNYEVDDGAGGSAVGLVSVNVGLSFRILANNLINHILQWDGVTWEFLGELVRNPPDTQLAHSITLGPDGNLYVGWTGKGTSKPASVRKHDPITGQQLSVYSTFELESDGSAEKLEALIFAPNGQLLVADNTGWNGTRKIFRFQGLDEPNPGAFIDEFIGYEEYQRTRSFETWDLDFDAQGNLLVPSAARHEIIIFDGPKIGKGKSRILDMFASAFVYEDRDDGVFNRISGRYSDPAESGFDAARTTSPYGLAWGPDGNLYTAVRDSSRGADGKAVFLGRIMRFSPGGKYLGDYVSTDDYAKITPGSPRDIDFGPDGNLYVTTRDSKIVIFGAPDGLQAGQHIGTLTAPDWVTFNGSSSIEFIED